MNLENLKKYAEGMSSTYPDLDEQIRDLYFLAEQEVQDGESETHECELAITDIKDLIAKWDIQVERLKRGEVELVSEDEFNQLIVDAAEKGEQIEFEDE